VAGKVALPRHTRHSRGCWTWRRNQLNCR